MTEIQMPPLDMRTHAADREQARTLLIHEAKRRIGARLAFVLAAVDDFADQSVHHIDDHLRGFDESATFSFGAVVKGLTKIMAVVVLPEAALARACIEVAVTLMTDNLEHAVEAGRHHDVSEAKAQLHDAVRALKVEVRGRQMRAGDAAMAKVDATIDQALAQVADVSNREEWIEAMCDWIGFVEPSRTTVYDPIRQALEYEFSGTLAHVQAEVSREVGIPGLDDKDLNPARWEREARDYEQKLYREEGEQAWDDAYKMSDE